MDNDLRILGLGTFRTGASLINNAISVHSKLLMLGERTHYFRFVHGKYDPLNEENLERLLEHMRIRLHFRAGMPFDSKAIADKVIARSITYENVYDEIMRHAAADSGKPVWGDYAQMGWKHVPFFLNAFPGGRVWHMCRDPRGVLASWRKITFQKDDLYLNFIFNWIDSVNHIKRYRASWPKDRYMAMRLEDVHARPEESMRNLTDFLGVEFEDIMLASDQWESVFDKRYVEANISSHTGEKVYGYDTNRSTAWKDNISDWEIALVEFLAGDLLDEMGYERMAGKVDVSVVKKGIDKLCKHPLTLKNLNIFLATGEGTAEGGNDPTDPKNWGVPDGFGKFSDTPAYQDYMDELRKLEDRLDERYATTT